MILNSSSVSPPSFLSAGLNTERGIFVFSVWIARMSSFPSVPLAFTIAIFSERLLPDSSVLLLSAFSASSFFVFLYSL